MEAYSQKLTSRSNAQVASVLGTESSAITVDVDVAAASSPSSSSSSDVATPTLSSSSSLPARLPHWKTHHFAIGESFSTWEAELEYLLDKSGKNSASGDKGDSDEEMLPNSTLGTAPEDLESGIGGGSPSSSSSSSSSFPVSRPSVTCSRVSRALLSECRKACDDGTPRDHNDSGHDCGCRLLSALVCSRLNVRRVGNMPVLCSRKIADGGRGGVVLEPGIIVGPYWPVMLFITYPLIIIVSLICLAKLIRDSYLGWLIVVWFLSTLCVIVSLFQTACRNPGLLVRRVHTTSTVPPSLASVLPATSIAPSTWRWSDQAFTYRPSGAVYDDECKVVCREFDHVCPWTGTAIAEDNMTAFKCFVSGICGLLVLDAVLLAGGLAMLKTNSDANQP